jgi:hypothetical protein
MGCCGKEFKDKLSVAKGIEKNTLEFDRHRDKLDAFMNRSKDLRESGICRNLVYDVQRDMIYCPLHPEQNQGNDLRVDHHSCDIMHLCKGAFLFEHWDDVRKKEFISFLKKKKKQGGLDWHSFSLGMADDSLVDEFEGLKWD